MATCARTLSGYLRAAQVLADPESGINGEPFNIGPAAEQNHTVLELLQSVQKFWKSDTLKKQFDIAENSSFHEAGLLKLNCDKALYYLQWRPALDFQATARMTGEWYNHYYNNNKKDISAYTLNQILEYAEAARKNQLHGCHRSGGTNPAAHYFRRFRRRDARHKNAGIFLSWIWGSLFFHG